MPLKLNVGLSRKVGDANYGSRGASVNLEMELESALVGEPAKLKERIRQLFDVVRSSLTEELNGNGKQTPANGENGSTDNGHPQANGHAQPPARPATQSQVKALFAIAKSQRLDLSQVLRDRFHVARPDDLSLKEASNLIDQLKRKE